MSTTSRRAVLAGAASLPALAVSAVAGSLTPDPIFAAIEAHRLADDAYGEAACAHDVAKGEERERLELALSQATLAEDSARWDLGDVTPTTAAGCIALLTYVHESTAFQEDDRARVIERLTEALTALSPEARS